MTDLAHYQGIIFDLDGTLVNSMIAHATAWEKTCKTFSIPYDKPWLDSLGGMPSRKVTLELLKRYELTLDPAMITADKTANYEAIEHKGEVIEETFSLLKRYAKTKKVGIGTGSQAKHAKAILATTSIPSYIQTLVTSDDVVNHKPHPDTFLQVAQNLSVPPENCVVFEDTQIGQQAATRAGMDCYMVKNGTVVQFIPARRP